MKIPYQQRRKTGRNNRQEKIAKNYGGETYILHKPFYSLKDRPDIGSSPSDYLN